jgi:hypothetical protein
MAYLRPKLAALLSLVMAGGALVAGCGGGGDQARPASENRPADTAQNEAPGGKGENSNQVSGNVQNGSGSNQSSSISQQSNGDANESTSQSSSSSGGVSTFSGDGPTTLSFNVEQPSRLAWTNTQGKRFTAHGGGISIDSSGGHGESELHPGTYDNVHINGASWTVVVRPR